MRRHGAPGPAAAAGGPATWEPQQFSRPSAAARGSRSGALAGMEGKEKEGSEKKARDAADDLSAAALPTPAQAERKTESRAGEDGLSVAGAVRLHRHNSPRRGIRLLDGSGGSNRSSSGARRRRSLMETELRLSAAGLAALDQVHAALFRELPVPVAEHAALHRVMRELDYVAEPAVLHACGRIYDQLERSDEWERRGGQEEVFLKAYSLVQINSAGRFQDRILVVTTCAVYRCAWSFSKGKLSHYERQPFEDIEALQFGPLDYQQGTIPSLFAANSKLAEQIETLYGIRMCTPSSAQRNDLRRYLPFVSSSVADRRSRVFFAWVPPEVTDFDERLAAMQVAAKEFCYVVALAKKMKSGSGRVATLEHEWDIDVTADHVSAALVINSVSAKEHSVTDGRTDGARTSRFTRTSRITRTSRLGLGGGGGAGGGGGRGGWKSMDTRESEAPDTPSIFGYLKFGNSHLGRKAHSSDPDVALDLDINTQNQNDAEDSRRRRK